MESRNEPLREIESNVLYRHWRTLKQDIRMVDIVDHLIETGVLKPETWDEIRKKTTIERERTEEFLLILLRRSSDHFRIFKETLREHGYRHLAEKLDLKVENHNSVCKSHRTQQKSQVSGNIESEATTSEIMKTLKELRDNDAQRQKDLVAMKQKQEINSQNLEKRLASNLKQTKVELNKLKESLRHKDEEINKLKQIQHQQEESNKSLTEEKKKLEIEKEQVQGKLKLQKLERGEIELRLQKHKLNEERMAREKEKLKTVVDRQIVQLEQETFDKNKAMDNLQRERTTVELMKRENTELKERIERLEDENETLSARPYTSRTYRDIDDMDRHSLMPYRRQPTGLSENGDNTSMGQLLNQRRDIEAEIKRNKIEQKWLKKRLRELNTPEPGPVDSQVCLIQ